jgi:hypothetical protein
MYQSFDVYSFIHVPMSCDQARIYARATGAQAQGGKFPGAAD